MKEEEFKHEWGDDSRYFTRLADDFNEGIPFDLEEYHEILNITNEMGFSNAEAIEAVMVLKKQDVREITEYLFSDRKDREVKYEAVKKEKAEVCVGKNIQLVEELLDLQEQVKKEQEKIAHLQQQIEEHKGLTDLQYYQQYLSACIADDYINEQEKKGLNIERKNRGITEEQHLQVLKNLCITVEEYENMLKPKRTGTDMCANCMNHPREIVLLPCSHLALCESCSVGEGGKSIRCPICHREATESIRAYWN